MSTHVDALVGELAISSGPELITPETAKHMLSQVGPKQRRVSDARVRFYAKQMKEGAWQLNGEAIIVSDQGRLLDGQHRLLAIRQSQLAQTVMVVRGVKERAFATLDSGRSRTVADLMRMQGVKYANEVAAALRWQWQWDTLALWADGRATGARGPMPGYVALEMLERYPSYPPLTGRVMTKMSSFRAFPGPSVFAMYQFTQIDDADAWTFLGQLVSGAHLNVTDGIYRMRSRVLNHKYRQQPRDKLTSWTYLALLIKSWNSWRQGRPVQQLTWRRSEPFPRPV
jgi:hypothetical protein